MCLAVRTRHRELAAHAAQDNRPQVTTDLAYFVIVRPIRIENDDVDGIGACVSRSRPFGGVHRGLPISSGSIVVASQRARSRTSSLVGRTRGFSSSMTSISAVSSAGADGHQSVADTVGL